MNCVIQGYALSWASHWIRACPELPNLDSQAHYADETTKNYLKAAFPMDKDEVCTCFLEE